jgi:hypothetical protein
MKRMQRATTGLPIGGRGWRSRTPWAISRTKAPESGVFPEGFATLGHLSDLARWGYPPEKRLTSSLNWHWAISTPWPAGVVIVRSFSCIRWFHTWPPPRRGQETTFSACKTISIRYLRQPCNRVSWPTGPKWLGDEAPVWRSKFETRDPKNQRAATDGTRNKRGLASGPNVRGVRRTI